MKSWWVFFAVILPFSATILRLCPILSSAKLVTICKADNGKSPQGDRGNPKDEFTMLFTYKKASLETKTKTDIAHPKTTISYLGEKPQRSGTDTQAYG